MKIQPYVNKLESSTQFKDFQQKFNDAFLVAGFFVIDFESGNNLHQIDYYVPSKKKFAAFTLDKGVQIQLMNSLDKKIPNKLDMKTNIDLDSLHGIIEDEMKNRNITQSIKKMIAVIQNLNGKKVWNVNCVLSGMDILKVHVEDSSETILKMEKNSMMDYIKRMPNLNQQAQTQTQASPSQPQVMQKPSKEVLEKQIAQLDKLKEALKQEEVEMEKDNSEQAKANEAQNKQAIVKEKQSASKKAKKK